MSEPSSQPTTEDLLVAMLYEAEAKLGSRDLFAKDSRPVIQEALELLDDLHARLGHLDSRVFPRGARRRLEGARAGLRFPGKEEIRRGAGDVRALASEVRTATADRTS